MRVTVSVWVTAVVLATTTVSGRQAPGEPGFTDITAAAGLNDPTSGAHGACWADATGDGLPDLFVAYNDVDAGTRRNRFFRNLGQGRFIEEALERGIASQDRGTHGCAWADMDNDGDYDLLQGITFGPTAPVHPNRLFRNDGTTFTLADAPALAAQAWPTRAILASDFDGNGWLDIFSVNGWLGSGDPPDERNELYFNAGSLTLTADTTSPILSAPMGQGGTDVDFDNDGDVDLVACNGQGPLNVYRNEFGRLIEVSAPAIGLDRRCYSGVTFGDVDNDGDQDAILMDRQGAPRAYLYFNRGNGTFSFGGEAGGSMGFSAGLADFDNDGDLDVAIPGLGAIYLGTGTGAFSVGPALPVLDPEADPRSIAFADYDRDGDLDMVITTTGAGLRLLRNDLPPNHWLEVRLISPQGQAGAFGATLRVFDPATHRLLALREARSNYGYLSQDEPVLHVGLGSRTSVDVSVRFPNGAHVDLAGVAADALLVVDGVDAVPLDPPGQPQALTAQVTGQSVALAWEAPSTGGAPEGYVIEAGTDPGEADLADLDVGALTSFSTTAQPGTYYVRVRAHNAAGLGPASNEILVSVGGCSTPTHLTAAATGHTVELHWDGRADRYLIEAGSIPGSSNLAAIWTTVTDPIFENVPYGTYYVRVHASDACGLSASSNEIMVQLTSDSGR